MVSDAALSGMARHVPVAIGSAPGAARGVRTRRRARDVDAVGGDGQARARHPTDHASGFAAGGRPVQAGEAAAGDWQASSLAGPSPRRSARAAQALAPRVGPAGGLVSCPGRNTPLTVASPPTGRHRTAPQPKNDPCLTTRCLSSGARPGRVDDAVRTTRPGRVDDAVRTTRPACVEVNPQTNHRGGPA